MTLVATARNPRLADLGRRGFDLLGAAFALIVLLPVMIICCVAVVASSRGPVVFRQTRVGRFGRPFTVLKFRTMRQDSDDAAHRAFVTRMLTTGDVERADAGLYKMTGDARVTRVGAFLRKSSLDELPQLLNVVRGDMSLVGPRPVLPWEAELFQARHQARFEVRPGMTGLWQVSGRGRLTMTEALELDVEYVRNRRMGLDLKILLLTIPAVFARNGTS